MTSDIDLTTAAAQKVLIKAIAATADVNESAVSVVVTKGAEEGSYNVAIELTAGSASAASTLAASFAGDTSVFVTSLVSELKKNDVFANDTSLVVIGDDSSNTGGDVANSPTAASPTTAKEESGMGAGIIVLITLLVLGAIFFVFVVVRRKKQKVGASSE